MAHYAKDPLVLWLAGKLRLDIHANTGLYHLKLTFPHVVTKITGKGKEKKVAEKTPDDILVTTAVWIYAIYRTINYLRNAEGEHSNKFKKDMLFEYTRVAVEGHPTSAKVLAHRWATPQEKEEEKKEQEASQSTSQPPNRKRRLEASISRARKVMKTAWGGA